MRKGTSLVRCLAPFFFCLLTAGCGSDDGLATVMGTVTLNGQPLADATVQFRPTSSEGASSFGRTDAEGRYKLMRTVKTAGAMPGEYIVSIRTADTLFADGGDETEQEERVPAKYNTQSELKHAVEPGTNTIDFDL